MGVIRNAASRLPAEQVRHRRSEPLRLQVPQRNVNCRYRPCSHDAALTVTHHSDAQLLRDALDVIGVLADQQMTQVIDGNSNQLWPARALAGAHQSGVSVQRDEAPVAAARERGGARCGPARM